MPEVTRSDCQCWPSSAPRRSTSCSAACTSWPSRPDILTGDHQQVVLPDLNAGCSMADMADIDQVEEAWDELARVTDIDRVVPITYMNSAANLKAFVARHGGAVCTSSNARAVLRWALERGDQVLFFPDQHLGRNTGFDMGYDESHMAVWNPRFDMGGLTEAECKESVPVAVEGALLSAPAVPARPCGRLPGRIPRRNRGSPP